MMTAKLNDLQSILLCHAAQQAGGQLLPLPTRITSEPAQLDRAIAALIKRKFVGEVEVSAPAHVWREAADRPIGLAITQAGLTAIDVAEDQSQAGTGEAGLHDRPVAAPEDQSDMGGAASHMPETVAAPPAPPAPITKIALVLALLRREGGATLGELVQATGWLPHTTRAALTGLRKKGHAIARGRVRPDGVEGSSNATCYRIV